MRLFLNADKWRIVAFENFNCKAQSWETCSRINWEYVYVSFCTFPFSMYSCEQPRGHYVGPSTVGGLIERAALLRIASLLYATVLIFMRSPMTLRQDSVSYIKRREKVINSDHCITGHTRMYTQTSASSYISRDCVICGENERNILHTSVQWCIILTHYSPCHWL